MLPAVPTKSTRLHIALLAATLNRYRNPMQATVLRFDATDCSGSVLFDDGRVLPFSGEVFRASGLRLLRPGQRLRLSVAADGSISALTIVTLRDAR